MRIRRLLRSLLCCPNKRVSPPKAATTAAVKEKPNQQDSVALQYKNAVEFGKFSFNLEEKRGQSLITHSGHMLTAFSLYSAALLTLLAALLSDAFISRTHLFIASTFIAIPLVLSLVFTMLAQWRFKYEAPIDAMGFSKAFAEDADKYQEQFQFDYQFILQLHQVQESNKLKNDKRLFFIRIAMICFFIAIGMLIAAYIILSVIYTKGA